MENILEDQRRLHEERERIIQTQVQEILRKKVTHREQINSDHLVKILWQKYLDASNSLLNLYEDNDGQRKKEIQLLSGPNDMNEFYSRLKVIQQNRKNSIAENTINVPIAVEYENMVKAFLENENEEFGNVVTFTDEEGYGRYVDLNEIYQKYINLKGIEKITYIKYLQAFDQLFAIPREKKNQDYSKYLESLYDYLYNYLAKVKPLLDIESELNVASEDFEKKWNEGSFPGWPKETAGALTKSGAYLDLTVYSSWEELASLGLDRLKSALMALGIKCGGTLDERAKRLFQTKGKKPSELDPDLFAKNQQNKTKEYSEKHKELAALEAKVYKLTELLSLQRSNTVENVQRKQARTGEEREEDEDDDINEEQSDDDDEDEVIYNPKNLPLGWDGKPIPYWLYKLHGLNLYYDCEICGNQKYRGPKAFQRHFSEWRHAHGMRCLGIPNTAHFANITSIVDAVQLWEKLKQSRDHERFKADNEEEYEDSFGNVLNKKTYEDLKKQCLL